MTLTIVLNLLLAMGLIAVLIGLLAYHGLKKDIDHRLRLLGWHRGKGEAHRRKTAWIDGR